MNYARLYKEIKAFEHLEIMPGVWFIRNGHSAEEIARYLSDFIFK